MRTFFLVLILLLAPTMEAMALVSGTFFAQATQGTSWRGLAHVGKEAMHIKVQPDYLDVEVEWEMTVRADQWPPNSHLDALEIVGTLQLEPGATVVGLLVWYKDMILKGKLKPDLMAREQYEKVVDRNVVVPPRPRDPVLLEEVSPGIYNVSVFPVSLGGSRKIRFRYLIPFQNGHLPFPLALTASASVGIDVAPGLDSVSIHDGMKRVLTFASAARFDNRDFCVSRGSAGCAYRNQAEGLMRFVQPHAADAAEGSRLLVGGFTGKGMAGHMIHSLLRVPPGLLADLKEPDPTARIFVTLYSGKDSCEIALPSGAGPIGAGTFSHRAFAAEMPSGVLRWRLDRKGRWSAEVREQARILPAEDGRQYARTFGKLPFYPMAKTMPRSLGLALGFIDTAYSLVALEEDAIDDKAEIRYADEGVPTLEPDDIFAAEDEAYDLPLQTWLFMRRTRLEDLRQATAIEAGASFPEGIRFSFADGVLRILVDAALLRGGGALRLSLHDLSGKEIKAWSRADLVGGSIAWSSRQGPHRAGVYLLRVHAAGKTRAAMVRVP